MNWDALYERAFAFEKLRLWELMTDDQIFAIQVNNDICYISIIGLMKQHFALGVYVGDEGLRTFYRVNQNSINEDEKRIAAMSQNNIQCAYLSKDALTPEERKPVRAYAREHAISMKNARYPLFLHVSRYQRADDISKDHECDILLNAFDAALWLGPEVISGQISIPHLRTNAKTIPLLIRDGSEFRVTSTPAVSYEIIPFPVGHTDETRLVNQTRKLTQSGRWACKLILINETYPADGVEGEFFPWKLVTYDLKNRREIVIRKCRDYENRTDVLLRQVMNAMLELNKRPESILVSDIRTNAFLSEWCRDQNIPLLSGEMPDELDTLINASLYEKELVRNDVPEEFKRSLYFFLLASDEEVLKREEDFDRFSTMLSSMLYITDISDPLKKNIEKVLRRLSILQEEAAFRKEFSESEVQNDPSVQGYVISVSFGTGCYRHIQIPADDSLVILSDEILSAFNFYDDHGHVFFMAGRFNDAQAYYMPMEGGPLNDNPSTCEITLREAGLHKGKKFQYLFDYGDKWLFHCKVLRELDYIPDTEVIKAKGEPPEQYPNYDDE
ncbi:MAG: hypothetical protein IJ088_06635 [Clostridia bacterium]|nr:hypothetical protein [Clostridia bacterium]